MFDEAKARLDANIRADITTFDQLAAHFGPAADDEDANVTFKGWVRCAWSRPTGEALEEVTRRLKTLRLTIRNAPMVQPEIFGPCLFTGEPGVEEILIARAY
jgi:prolyl-tRNA synthetase